MWNTIPIVFHIDFEINNFTNLAGLPYCRLLEQQASNRIEYNNLDLCFQNALWMYINIMLEIPIADPKVSVFMI